MQPSTIAESPEIESRSLEDRVAELERQLAILMGQLGAAEYVGLTELRSLISKAYIRGYPNNQAGLMKLRRRLSKPDLASFKICDRLGALYHAQNIISALKNADR